MAKATAEYNLEMVYPDIAKQWHPLKNGVLCPCNVAPRAHRKVWWRCSVGHEWEASIDGRVHNGCPYCSGRCATKQKNLAIVFPVLAEQWHPTKNEGISPQSVSPHSRKIVWWLCPRCGHEWRTAVYSRVKRGCPGCSGRSVTYTHNLAMMFPYIAGQWNQSKNGNLSPQNVAPKSRTKVWWICSRKHEWAAKICDRTSARRNGCPHCSKRISKRGNLWLDACGLPEDDGHREVPLHLGHQVIMVDGLNPDEKIVYEFLGDYWHGNPKKFNPADTNPSCGKTYGELFKTTVNRFKMLVAAGYRVVYKWESSDQARMFLCSSGLA